MSDFKHINEFRKGSVLSKISEDPTYLSFFFMFDGVDREHSPLLAGPAEEYLEKMVDANMGTTYAKKLANFRKVLFKINKEMPWFWQSVTGLELVETYGKMDEPYRGQESPKIEIECLEENVELTAVGLMTLYKNACYDFRRYVEILPKNLRHFRVWTVLSEVRTFQQSTVARDLNLYGAEMPGNNAASDINIIPKAKGYETAVGKNVGEFDAALTAQYTADAKPHVMFELGFCEWQIDTIAGMFADQSKNPEKKKPKVSFVWQTGFMSGSKFGENIAEEEKVPLFPAAQPNDGLYPNQPFNPLAIAQNAISDKVNGLAGGLVNRFNNLKNSLPGFGNNPLGRVYPEGLTGAAATLANRGMDAVKGLLLDNVHGSTGFLGSLSDINSALEAGSINAILNLAGQLNQNNTNVPSNGNITPVGVYDPGIDSSPDLPINQKVYDPIAQEPESQNITPGRIHEPGVDSSPDDNINENVHS